MAGQRNKALTRREMVQLCGVAGFGVAVSGGLRFFKSPGIDIGMTPAVRGILADGEAPVGGNPEGDVTIVAYTDYHCPACRVANSALQSILASDPGVRVLFKDWPSFGETSRQAARWAIASNEQGVYVQVHDQFMRTLERIDRSVAEAAIQHAGGEWEQLEHTIKDSGRRIENMLNRHAIEAFSLGLRGTPGFLIGSVVVNSLLTEAEFANLIAGARAL